MFIYILILILVLSFLLALRSGLKLSEKPKIGEVKKSLDKHRVIFRSHSSK